MKVLLDTHVVLWWLGGSKLLSKRAAIVLRTAETLLVSPLSCWEIAALARKRKIRLDDDPHAWARSLFSQEHVEQAPLSPEAAVTAAQLQSGFPGDPVDRLLYATALEMAVPMLTRDEAIRRYAASAKDVQVVW